MTRNGVVELLGVFRGEASVLGRQAVSLQGKLVAGEMLVGSERTWGGWGWVRASSGCPSVFLRHFEFFCEVEGPSSLQSGGDWTVGTCGRSYCCLVVRGARIEVARCA